MNNDCIFCKIVKGDIPSYKVFEDKNCLAFLDISADCLGHTLVVLKEHTQNFLKTPQDKLNLITMYTKKIAEHYVNNLGFDGVQIVVNNGESSGQSVMHLHYHILPSVLPENKKFANYKQDDLQAVCNLLRLN